MPGLDLVETTSAAVLEHYLCSQTRQSPQDARPQHRPSAALDSLPSRLVHGVIPVTPISLPSLARKRKTPPDEQDTSLFDVTHISSSSLGSPSPSSPPRAESEPPLSTRPPSVPVPDSKLHLAPSSDDLGLARFCQPAARDRDDIMPPSPPTGIRPIHPQDLISDELAKLAQHLSSRFRPVYSRPPTEPLERGYWLINCSLWPRPARHAMWTFLENYLSSGLAGWGVWCRRRRSEASTPNCTTTGTDDDADANDDWIRLYCWACVVKHMYLLLYLASDRRLKTTHAAWIGADGDTVLEVLPSDYRA
ncbi:hypothetical protein CDD81_6248 [Ophiocordyceps australis]|uniref:Uncharacterized protein n=1 Tax=Ophiocordyceps australis TaxID=1399860 RepID=A0A2C5XSH7_9HYPO|nr:hypothetical protein CDD81_6248 [Ophiocordyceps australis]